MRWLNMVALSITCMLLASCTTGGIQAEKRSGNYLVLADLGDVTVADVGYKGVPPTLRTVANAQWGVDIAAGNSVAQVIGERVQGTALAVDDDEILQRISYEKVLLMRRLDADDAEFIRDKYAAQSPQYLVLVTRNRVGMSELYGAGVRQKDIPLADFHCQFFASMQLDVFELETGKILSTLTESQYEDCAAERYFDDINRIDDKALAEMRSGVGRITTKTANKLARHLLMTDAEKDEFKMRLPGFE